MVPCDGPVLVAFGASLNPLYHLELGLRRLHALLGIVAISDVYQSRPVNGAVGDPPFLNGAVRLEQAPEPWALRALLRQIEAEQGRERGDNPNAPRTLDLDIALMGSQIMDEPLLRIPDPHWLARPFVALPMAQLAAAWRHPEHPYSLAQLAARFDPLPVGMHKDLEATRRLRQILPPFPNTV
ncbi:2-amino-4-hydroxy-6-hydroxymethyldihydropteridine pyrophosphokinase [Magnetococcus marinus MC-1]|uniref:2-amino-4-hydroxy-6-hydroxymethyldihydropteridine pyrophosphokinase n=2 Tax=Magnetococcus TaxID=162171 RepID=A0L4G3_MAGMM|nr:2-amino-4-hydroxy-6-hydroxymethyldihydropteridine pyrophosphokinase [Magnetococcus marinus MC-1]